MARQWRIKLTTPEGVMKHYIHDDGKWEWDSATANMMPSELASLTRRMAEARDQFTRLGWTDGSLKQLEPGEVD